MQETPKPKPMKKTYELTVIPGDYGIRPAGKPDECFYCHSKVGQQHGPNCVVVYKRVKIQVTVELEVDVPARFDASDVEFHYNEGSSCADNFVGELQQYVATLNADGKCLCGSLEAKFIEVADPTPFIPLIPVKD